MTTASSASRSSWTLLDALPAGNGWRALAVLLGTAALSLGAQVTTPTMGDVPGTLQPLAVLLVGAVLGPWLGALSVVIYVLLGAVGAPIFTGGSSGYGGPTSGYFLGFVVAAFVVGLITRPAWSLGARHAGPRVIVGMLAGIVIIYVGGLAWLMARVGLSFSDALSAGFEPFIVGDLLEGLIAVAIVLGLASRYGPKGE